MLSLAPMEGLTGYIFRNTHAEIFGQLDRYYTPFLSPPRVGCTFGKRSYAEIDPKNNRGLNVIPQLLTNNAKEFVWAAHLLAELGYQEVNLNLGCPSGTVVSKGKGAGFLNNLQNLDAFLGEICEHSPIPVSVKTRIGVLADEEYEQILEVYCHHPLAELIVHPRVRQDYYKGTPRWAAYGKTLHTAPFPVAYNGDIFSCADKDALIKAYPETRHIMLGRGILANPALARMLAGGQPATCEEIIRFHNLLFHSYENAMGRNAIFRMKEWWHYAKFNFSRPLAVHRAIRKTRTVAAYLEATEKVFATERLAEKAVFADRRAADR